MRGVTAIFVGFLLMALAAGACRAQAKPPYEIVRSLEALHDQMVLGSHSAQSAMPGVLRQLGAKLMAEDASVWRDPRNARAVIIYILSGGEIRVARKVLASGACSAREKQLIEGALAYLEGYKSRASELLGNIDPRTLDPTLGAHVALAQAALIAPDKPAQAMKLLDVARVLAPGTLVEDAALRREVFLAEETGDFDKFLAMSNQYFRRFKNSVYVESFLRDFVVALTRISQSGTMQQLTELSDLLKSRSTHEQLRFYLYAAQASLINGKSEPAKWASTAALTLAAKDSPEARRAALYNGAASILTTDYDRGLAELDAVDPSHLAPEDALLRETALGLAAQIRQWTVQKDRAEKTGEASTVAASPPPVIASGTLPAALAERMRSSDQAIASVQKLLAESDALLEGQEQ